MAELRVQQRLVALASAPQHVVLAAEAMRHLEHVPHLRSRMGEDIGVGVGGRTGRVPRVREQVGGAPQQLHAAGRHLLGCAVDEHVEVGLALPQRRTLRSHVDVVEAVVRRAQLGEELERRVLLGERRGHRVGAGLQPWAIERAGTEHVAAGPVEAVPIADGDAEVILHALAGHDAVRVVHEVLEAVPGRRARWGHRRRDVGEELGHGAMLRTIGISVGETSPCDTSPTEFVGRRQRVWRTSGGSTAHGAASPHPSSKTRSASGRRRTGPC